MHPMICVQDITLTVKRLPLVFVFGLFVCLSFLTCDSIYVQMILKN